MNCLYVVAPYKYSCLVCDVALTLCFMPIFWIAERIQSILSEVPQIEA